MSRWWQFRRVKQPAISPILEAVARATLQKLERAGHAVDAAFVVTISDLQVVSIGVATKGVGVPSADRVLAAHYLRRVAAELESGEIETRERSS